MIMDTKEILKSKKIKIAALVVGVVIISLVSFAGGVAVGIHKARFSYRFGQNYERNFIGGPFSGSNGIMGRGSGGGGMMGDFEGRGFRNAHGIAGQVISISGNNIVIQNRNGQENTVTVSDKTLIKSGSNDIKITDLKADERIVVMGQPGDSGTINADLIRVFDGANMPNNVNSGGNGANNPSSTPSGNNNTNANNPGNNGQ